jgi:hypothetical protein
VDQSEASASGCSVDSSVRLVKELGKELEVDFFNRMQVVVENQEGQRSLYPYRKLAELQNHVYYNPLVESLKELKETWLVK